MFPVNQTLYVHLCHQACTEQNAAQSFLLGGQLLKLHVRACDDARVRASVVLCRLLVFFGLIAFSRFMSYMNLFRFLYVNF